MGSGGLGWRLPICVGLMVAPLLYRLLCYIGSFAIYIMCGVFGEGLPLHARHVPTGGWNLAPDLE